MTILRRDDTLHDVEYVTRHDAELALEAAAVHCLLEVLPVARLAKLALDEPKLAHLATEARGQLSALIDNLNQRLGCHVKPVRVPPAPLARLFDEPPDPFFFIP